MLRDVGHANEMQTRCGQKYRNGALKAFAVPFERAFKASEDVRHLNVVVIVSCVNELSLLSGFLGRFFLGAAFFCGLLFSCHSVVSPSLAFWL